ncbi:Zn(2)-C6 fungal-type domain-containing protein [Mycena sanguinolenta]|uniref:Zn(2)-C6 fungal-type domain-containing protein n=1 Tax=Mycena sanguinolenta TaxID=230812 RepID=A0A8H7DC38_9AGAR|nr:Zn(2)-C6 fungal-type domain-containing protein [Mycena sanguinolenta]
MSIEPRLPPDLERKVFELAAHEDSRTAFRIILVAHRCRSWVEPILYRSVVVCQSSWSFPLFLRTLDVQPTHYAQWIKEIQIDPYVLPNDPAVPRVLSICTSVVHLIDLSHGRTPFSVLSQLRLTRLCISLDIIDGLAEGAYFSHPAFAQLTHLHVLDAPQRWLDIPFSDLPALTHLALQNYKNQIRSTNVPVLKKILTECRNLQVLVVFIMFSRPDDCNTQNTKLLVDDPRLTILPRTSARREDIWDFAKESTDNTVMAIETRSNNIWATKVCIHPFYSFLSSPFIPHPAHQKKSQKTDQ